MFRSRLFSLLALLWLQPIAMASFDGGHTKIQWLASTYPDDSIFRDVLGANAQDQSGELRLKLGADTGPWSFKTDYQLIARHGDSWELCHYLFRRMDFLPDPDPKNEPARQSA